MRSYEMKNKDLKQQLEMYKLIYDNLYGGSIVVDDRGYITHFSKTYSEYLQIDPEDVIGKHCTEIIENTRMHIVAQTGKPEIAAQFFINGKNMITHRIPIYKDKKLVAVLGQMVVRDLKELKPLMKELSLLESKVKLYEEELSNLRATRYSFNSIIGDSAIMRALKKEAMRASYNDFSVLLMGESGTGKELFAQAIHNSSNRSVFPFVRINCAAIPRELLESELFGYESGAFTGANPKGRIGKFELANHGTIFLDEIGDLPLELQPKLLRVLEEKEFERIGGNEPIKSDFRVISATNKNLEQMMEKGFFRSDLFYRIGIIPISIPPLRDRKNDIIQLSEYLLDKIVDNSILNNCKFTSDALAALVEYRWPGNGRELFHVLERIVCSLSGNTIGLEDIPPYIIQKVRLQKKYIGKSLKDAKKLAEREAISEALRENNYNKTLTAKKLGIHRSLLYKKIRENGIRETE